MIKTAPASAVRMALDIDTGSIREEKLFGADHIVAEAVMLVEGVFHAANAEEPELVTRAAFENNLSSWNGRPVVINHPKRNGQFVSANNPAVLEEEVVGTIFNTRINDEGTALKTEVWLNIKRAEELGEETVEVLNSIKKGEVQEVSVGAFTNIIKDEGTFKGEKYLAKWSGVWPDHLAILPTMKGACSVEDGCGIPRAAEANTEVAPAPAPAPALRVIRVPQVDVANSDCDCGTDCDCESCVQRANTQKLRTAAVCDFRTALNDQMSVDDLRYVLLHRLEGDGSIIDIYDSYVIYLRFDYSDYSSGMYKIEYQLNGTDVIIGKSARVRPVTRYVDFPDQEETIVVNGNSEQEDREMSGKNEGDESGNGTVNSTSSEVSGIRVAAVDKLISGGKFKEESREELLALSDSVFQELIKKQEESLDGTVSGTDASKASTGTLGDLGGHTPKRSVAEFLQELPPEIKKVLTSGVKMLKKRQDALVSSLMALENCPWGEEELKAMEVEQLEKIAAVAVKAKGKMASTSKSTGVEESVDNFLTSFVGSSRPSVDSLIDQQQSIMPLPKSIFEPTEGRVN